MILLAKKEQSPGYKAFLDELVILYRQNIIQSKERNPNPNMLTAEFKEEVTQMGNELPLVLKKI